MTDYQIMEDMLIKYLKQFAKKPVVFNSDNEPISFASNWGDEERGAVGALHILCTMTPENYDDWTNKQLLKADPDTNNQVMKEVYLKILGIGKELSVAMGRHELNISRLVNLQRLLCKISINLINENFIECRFNRDNALQYGWNLQYSSIHARRTGWTLMYPDDDRDIDGIPHWMKDYLIVCETVANRRTIMRDIYRPKEVIGSWYYDDQQRVAIFEKRSIKVEKEVDLTTIINIVKQADQEVTDGMRRACVHKAIKRAHISNTTCEKVQELRKQLTTGAIRYGIDGKSGTAQLVQICDDILFGVELVLSKK